MKEVELQDVDGDAKQTIMGFKLKNKNIPTNFKANYVRPTNLSIEKSPLKQTGAGSFTGNPLFAKISGAASRFADNVKKMDAEDFIIPQPIQNLVPINVRAFASDLMGRDREITERHLSKKELAALTAARERAEARGSDRIEYQDYDTGDDPYADVGGDNEESTLDFIKKNFDPNYAVKTTFGQMSFKKNEDGTYTYDDKYNFNNAEEGGMEAFNKALEENPDLTAYQKLRLLAKFKGSGPGEGANVKIIT